MVFRTPDELVKYLDYLDNNSTAYMEYHAWRTDEADLNVPALQPADRMTCGACQVIIDFYTSFTFVTCRSMIYQEHLFPHILIVEQH